MKNHRFFLSNNKNYIKIYCFLRGAIAAAPVVIFPQESAVFYTSFIVEFYKIVWEK